MKTSIKKTKAIFPMPVLMVATYNEDGSVNVMNAAWGTMIESDIVAINITETHKTAINIKNKKAFTVSFANAKYVVEADYFGVESGNKDNKKFEKSGLTYTPSVNVDAPVINEFPICLECEFIEYQSDEYGIGVVGKVVNTLIDEEYVNDGNIDVESMEAIIYDSYTHGYYAVGKRVGNAFSDGLKLKK